jgi:Ca2+-binding EF-hand superfamily protein
MTTLLEYLNSHDEVNVEFFTDRCKVSDVVRAFESAAEPSGEMKDDFVKADSPGNLVRCQFLELVVHLACVRFLNTEEADSEVGAINQLLNSYFGPDANDIIRGREEFLKSLFSEDNDVVMKENLEMLRVIFDVFRQQNCWPGLQGRLSHVSFLNFLDDLNCYDEQCTKRSAPICWPVGKVLEIDEYDGHDHLVMSFTEFLISVAFLVDLKADDADGRALRENLEDFFHDFVTPLYGMAVTQAAGADEDAAMKPIASVIVEMFFEADAKMKGSVTRDDFLPVYESPKFKEKMTKLGFSPTQVKDLFTHFEATGVGKVSPDELVKGFVKIKTSTRGMEKVLAFLKKTFENADEDGSGELDQAEFNAAFTTNAARQDLLRIGVDPDDVTSLFAECDKDGSGQVTLDEFVSAFIILRNPAKAHERLMQTIERLFYEFHEADKFDDTMFRRSMPVSGGKFRKFWTQEHVQRKFRKFKDLPDPDSLYNMLDPDKARSVTFDAMMDGLDAILKDLH